MAENHTASMTGDSPEPGSAENRRAADGATLISLCGEMDLLTATALREQLDALTAHPNPDLVVDLRSVTFIDCAGLGVLCRAHNRVLARRGRLRLVTNSADFLRMLRITELRQVFEVHSRLPHPAPGPDVRPHDPRPESVPREAASEPSSRPGDFAR